MLRPVALLVSRVVRTQLSKEKCATKAKSFIVLHYHDCREVHHHHNYDEHITIVLIIPYIASPLI